MLSDIKYIISLLKKGNEKAYCYLYDNYYKKLCKYSLNILNDKELAEDVVQSVMIKIYEKRLKLNFNNLNNLESYLYRAVHNNSITQYHKREYQYKHQKKIRIHFYDHTVDSSEYAIKNELNEILSSEIETLTNRCKNVFELSRFKGYSNREIAEKLEVSVKNVEYHLTNALRKLSERIVNYAAC